jgi:hypothetical protein
MKIKAVLVDPEKKELSEIELSKSDILEEIKAVIDCDTSIMGSASLDFSTARSWKHSACFDDVGRLAHKEPFFFEGVNICGKTVVTGVDNEGDSTSCTVEEVEGLVTFI